MPFVSQALCPSLRAMTGRFSRPPARSKIYNSQRSAGLFLRHSHLPKYTYGIDLARPALGERRRKLCSRALSVGRQAFFFPVNACLFDQPIAEHSSLQPFDPVLPIQHPISKIKMDSRLKWTNQTARHRAGGDQRYPTKRGAQTFDCSPVLLRRSG